MSDYLPKIHSLAATFTTSTAVVGGRAVAVTGNKTVGPAGAESAAFVGIAGFDAAAGQPVTVYIGSIQRMVAAGAIAAGARVATAAAGAAQTAATNPIGLALQPATTAGDVIDVLIN